MNALSLFVGMDFKGAVRHVGNLTVHSTRGKEYYSFRYAPSWVGRENAFAITPSFPLTSDIPYRSEELWGAFQDVSPDRWGCLVQTRIQGGSLTESEFMLGVSDYMRMGALRLSDAGKPDIFLAAHTDIPKLVHLREIESASRRLEANKETEKDLAMLLQPGSSLGGARPKAAVEDGGALWIAKFGSLTDTEREPLREATMLDLAGQAGIDRAEYRVIDQTGKRPILLVKRFDRAHAERIPFMSAMTMLERNEKTSRAASYLELADGITRFSSRPKRDKQELWRRMLFNAMTGNTDDHLRNHAFLRDSDGWRLSPAYDLTPTNVPLSRRVHALSFDGDSYRPSLALCLKLMPYFDVDEMKARETTGKLRLALKNWKNTAKENGLKTMEINRMSVSLEHDDAAALTSF
jgi:serine/threonine-protein kinase HipA